MAVQLSVLGLYLPASVENTNAPTPPQTIISLPVQTAVCASRAVGRIGSAGGCPSCPCWDCICRRCSNIGAVQIRPRRSFRCRSILPCERLGHRAHWWCWWPSNCPCWDCISRRYSNSCCRHQFRPRRSFRCQSRLPCDRSRAAGALVVLVFVQLSVLGLYLPPVLTLPSCWSLRPRRSFRCRSKLLCDSRGQEGRWSC